MTKKSLVEDIRGIQGKLAVFEGHIGGGLSRITAKAFTEACKVTPNQQLLGELIDSSEFSFQVGCVIPLETYLKQVDNPDLTKDKVFKIGHIHKIKEDLPSSRFLIIDEFVCNSKNYENFFPWIFEQNKFKTVVLVIKTAVPYNILSRASYHFKINRP